MKKLLFQLDTDPTPSVFDNVVCYDGGADHITAIGGVTPDNVGAMVDGAIFTRAPKDKKYTALFLGGSNMVAGETLLKAVQKKFFANFRVSVMLDSNGSNTTAAACVASLQHGRSLAGMKAVILAGTGPVGSRAAVMLAREGVEVTLTSRKEEQAQKAVEAIHTRFGITVKGIAAPDVASRAAAIEGADIVIATGAGGIELLREEDWAHSASLKLIADANATPPLGITGIDVMDKGVEKHGKISFGAIGFGALKIALQRACVEKLFESNALVLDAEEIYAIAKTMVA